MLNFKGMKQFVQGMKFLKKRYEKNLQGMKTNSKV
jgi:hypothetical protein